MKAQAEADGDVFLPNPEPQGPVDCVLICMEPSLGGWASSADHARQRVEEGFRNFLASIDTQILHFCIRRYLCGPGERYHITDFSKGAMPIKHAALGRAERYERWYMLLQEEIGLVAAPDAGIIAVGNAVEQHLQRRCFPRPFARILHYSGLAARGRQAGIVGHEDDFEAFCDTVSLEDVITTAEDVLRESGVPGCICDDAVAQLARSELTTSRKKLIFNYKMAFEAMRS